VSQFLSSYRAFLKQVVRSDRYHGFDIHILAKAEPFLSFLFHDWWRVEVTGLEKLPKEGPALIVGNSGSFLPWPGLMLLYALMSSRQSPRRLHIAADMEWIKDERLHTFLRELGFVQFSAENLKRLFAKGETVAIFPEGIEGLARPFSWRERLMEFDWVKILPAVEQGVPIYPLATLGCDESIPVLTNFEHLAKFLNLPIFPITPFFPWLPFPFNLTTLPLKWHMSLLKPLTFASPEDRDALEETAMKQSQFAEGEIQAELNRLLRQRWRQQHKPKVESESLL
jgi:1-acyl-sn-glycerol-3-phosphate acyltransferase